MTPYGVVEPLDVVEHISFGLVPGTIVLRSVRSVFNDEKKLSIAAVSQPMPDRLMLQTMPLSAIRRSN
jgi:hypothetical protein